MAEDFRKEEYWKPVEEFVTELKNAKYWFKNDGKPLPEWKLFETQAAAGDAARAAWAAAWDAARDAARDAAGDAGGDAWAAAGDAAGDAALFGKMLVCVGMGLRIEITHLRHVNARMLVWRKGYGLLCDVNGVLYVYKRI